MLRMISFLRMTSHFMNKNSRSQVRLKFLANQNNQMFGIDALVQLESQCFVLINGLKSKRIYNRYP
jgi:hypothetical protein